MGEPYLILHRVRGKPAFDIAERMECPVCYGTVPGSVCCDIDGFWWIIPTSGHRAYPLQVLPLSNLEDRPTGWLVSGEWQKWVLSTWSLDALPDHYSTNDRLHHTNYETSSEPTMIPTLYEPDPSATSLAQRLGLVPKIPPITRRL